MVYNHAITGRQFDCPIDVGSDDGTGGFTLHFAAVNL